MTAHDTSHAAEKTFVKAMEEDAGIKIADCYQCGKCTAGCPMVPDMDYTPSQIMRLIQLNRRETVLRSKAIWFCASCLMCTTRCPKDVKIAETMDTLREIALQEKKAHKAARKVLAFTRSFLNTVRRQGRLFEMAMVAEYKLRSRDIFADLTLAPKMFFKGKLNLFPPALKEEDAIKKIFEKTRRKKS